MQFTTRTTKDNPFFGLKARYLFLLLLLIYLVSYISYAFVLKITSIELDFRDPIREYIVYCLCFIGTTLYLLRQLHQFKIDLKSIFGKLPKGYRWILLFGLMFILLLFVLGVGLLFFSFVSLIAPSFIESLLEYAAETDSQISFAHYYSLLRIITVAIVAPITEEFIFRGLLLHIWASKWKTSRAILLSSLIFGFFHFNPIGISIAGIVLALLYIKTRSLLIPIVAHTMSNLIAISSPSLIRLATNNFDINELTIDNINNMWKLGLLLTILSTPFIVRFVYLEWPSKSTLLPYFANKRRDLLIREESIYKKDFIKKIGL